MQNGARDRRSASAGGASVDLVGSQAGTKEDCAAVLDLVAEGKLFSRITEIGFEEIPDGIGRLERGGIIRRLVATFGWIVVPDFQGCGDR